MHEQRLLAGLGHEFLVHLIWTEDLDALHQFVFLPHAGPYVGVDRIRALHIRGLRRPIDRLFLCRPIFLGTDRSELQPGRGADIKERTGNVIPISDIDQLFSGKTRPRFRQREKIRQGLAGVFGIAQPVYDGNRRKQRQILQVIVLEDARDNGVDPA